MSKILEKSRKATPAKKRSQNKTDHLELLGLEPLETPLLIKSIGAGLSYEAFERFVAATGLARDMVAGAIQVPPRTLSRRKDEGKLHADESDRLVRLARIFSLALDLFARDVEAARHWLNGPVVALGDATPLDYAATEVGAREVEQLIGRLEHGIPS